MGLLALGTPLEWPEAKKNANQVRAWGIEQLLTIWNKAKGKERDALLWGDEVIILPRFSQNGLLMAHRSSTWL